MTTTVFQRLLIRTSCLAFLVFVGGPRGVPADFVRGDVDASGRISVADAIHILYFLFLGYPGAVPCKDAADVDDNGTVELTDALFLLNSLFRGGSVPPAPFPSCGTDPTADALDCVLGAECEPSFQYFGFEFQAGAVSFVIDRSGTQQDQGELVKSKSETVKTVGALSDGTELGIVFADANVLKWPASGVPAVASPEIRESAIAFIKNTAGGQRSCDIPALLSAIDFAKQSKASVKAIFYVTDGGGTCGSEPTEEQYLERMRTEVTDANAGTAHLHTMGNGVGGSALHKKHLEDLAALNGGTFHEILP